MIVMKLVSGGTLTLLHSEAWRGTPRSIRGNDLGDRVKYGYPGERTPLVRCPSTEPGAARSSPDSSMSGVRMTRKRKIQNSTKESRTTSINTAACCRASPGKTEDADRDPYHGSRNWSVECRITINNGIRTNDPDILYCMCQNGWNEMPAHLCAHTRTRIKILCASSR